MDPVLQVLLRTDEVVSRVAYGGRIGETQDSYNDIVVYEGAVVIELHGLKSTGIVKIIGVLDGAAKAHGCCDLFNLDIWRTH